MVTVDDQRSCWWLRLIANSIDFPTKGTRQHPFGLEYLWTHDVQGLLLTCLLKILIQVSPRSDAASIIRQDIQTAQVIRRTR
uniref:Uncharacterized protein n=1 Tax=Hyaloperonospora arabidopsidis (strain Emoy2) TaxID=559515 RepID=M4B9D7_HYAAE